MVIVKTKVRALILCLLWGAYGVISLYEGSDSVFSYIAPFVALIYFGFYLLDRYF